MLFSSFLSLQWKKYARGIHVLSICKFEKEIKAIYFRLTRMRIVQTRETQPADLQGLPLSWIYLHLCNEVCLWKIFINISIIFNIFNAESEILYHFRQFCQISWQYDWHHLSCQKRRNTHTVYGGSKPICLHTH